MLGKRQARSRSQRGNRGNKVHRMNAEKVRYTQVSATARLIKQRQPARISQRTADPMPSALCA